MTSKETGAPATNDENRLAQFGYKQELKRDWGVAHNFGVSFSIIVSILKRIDSIFLSNEV